MTDPLDRVVLAQQQYEKHTAIAELARDALHGAIKDAKAAGVRQHELTARTGYSREHIRRICRDNGSLH